MLWYYFNINVADLAQCHTHSRTHQADKDKNGSLDASELGAILKQYLLSKRLSRPVEKLTQMVIDCDAVLT